MSKPPLALLCDLGRIVCGSPQHVPRSECPQILGDPSIVAVSRQRVANVIVRPAKPSKHRNCVSVASKGATTMTVTESKGLTKGNRVYWRGDATDSGRITETSWDAVTIAWDNGQVATVHHGDMREIERAPTKGTSV
jgi:hypothetical protein